MDTEDGTVSPALWKAVWQLADVWSQTPIVQEVSAALPRNRGLASKSTGASGIPGLVHHLEMVAGGLLHPLMYGSRIPVLLRDPMIATGVPHVDRKELNEWVQNAGRVETAHRRSLAWLRSSLAGYPVLRAPQLARRSPLTTEEMTDQFTWTRQELAGGFNRHSGPPGISDLLSAPAAIRPALQQAARDLSDKLCESPAWVQFNNAVHALDASALVELREARRILNERLAEDRINEHEQTLALPRWEFRAHTTADVIATLTGAAKAYADAFSSVHALLTLTACDVFGELALYGEPWPLPVVSVEVPEPGRPFVEFETSGAVGMLLEMGQVLWLDSNLVPDAVRLERTSFKMDLARGASDQFTARVLGGTAAGWSAPSTKLPDR